MTQFWPMRINLSVLRISGSCAFLIWAVPSFLTLPSSSCWNDFVRLEVGQPTLGSKDEKHVRMEGQNERSSLGPGWHPGASFLAQKASFRTSYYMRSLLANPYLVKPL